MKVAPRKSIQKTHPSSARAASGDGENPAVDSEGDVLFHAHYFPADGPVWRRRD